MFKVIAVILFSLALLLGHCSLSPVDPDTPNTPPPDLNNYPYGGWVNFNDTFVCKFSISRSSDNPYVFALDGAPEGVLLSDSNVTWVPTIGDTGCHQILVRVTDKYNRFDILTIAICVNMPPVILDDSVSMFQNIRAGTIYLDTLRVAGGDSDPLQFYLRKTPDWEVYLRDSIISWRVWKSDTGYKDFTIIVADNKVGCDSLHWNIKVHINDAPTFNGSLWNINKVATLNAMYRETLSVSDPDGGPVTLSCLECPAGFAVTDSIVTWMPTAASADSQAISLKISDTTGLSDTIAWKLFINHPPVFLDCIHSLADTLIVGNTYRDTLRAQDVEDATLTFGYKNASGQLVFIDPLKLLYLYTNRLEWPVDSTDVGQHDFYLYVRDKNMAYDSILISVCVKPLFSPVTQAAEFPGRYLHSSVVYDDKIWVIGGLDSNARSDVWYSSDAVHWIQATPNAAFGPRYGHASVVFNNKMWVIGGSSLQSQDVWWSTDGATWTRTTGRALLTPRDDPSAVVFNNKIWVQGGTDYDSCFADSWYSNDGLTWTRAYYGLPYTFTRRRHRSVSFDNKIWLVGGQYADGVWLHDVWGVEYSGNGIDWTLSNSIQPFSTEWLFPSVTVYNGRIWLVGGARSSTSCNLDVWTSATGLTWEKVTNDGRMGPRTGHTAVVFNGKLYLIGGSKQLFYARTFLNDVWVIR